MIQATELADTNTGNLGYVSSYDASFHALALRLEGVFLTADEAHYRRTKDSVGNVALLREWQDDVDTKT